MAELDLVPVCACHKGSTCDVSHDPATCTCVQCVAAESAASHRDASVTTMCVEAPARAAKTRKNTSKAKKNAIDVIGAVRKIAVEKQAARVDGALVDMCTANAIIRVYDALDEKNKAIFVSKPLRLMAAIAWKLVK